MDKKVGGPSPASEPQKADYFSGLGEELGIEWKYLAKILEKEPWVSSHFALGNQMHKLSAWEIVPGSFNHEGASIRLKANRGDRSYLPGKRLNKSSPDDQVYHLSRKQLVDFLTSGWTPAVQAAQGMADPSMGGGGMPPDPMAGGMPPV